MTIGRGARGRRARSASSARMRVRLHYLLGRREDRLVFDRRPRSRSSSASSTRRAKRASEQLMQRYYRAAKLVRQVNIILLQNLHARLLPGGHRAGADRRRIPARRRAARHARRATCSCGARRRCSTRS